MNARRLAAHAAALVALLGLAAPAAAQPWRYVDKKGRVHYTNDPNKLPAKKRKRAFEKLEKKRARAAAEAAAAAAAQPESAAATSAASIPLPAPESAASKAPEPTAHDLWKEKMQAADKAVSDLNTALSEARETAQAARRRAIITPSGFNSDKHAKAQAKLAELEGQLNDAKATRTRTQQAEPPVTRGER